MKNLLSFCILILKFLLTIKVSYLLYTSYLNSYDITNEIIWWMCLIILDTWILSNFNKIDT
jgi:hypothetical protein